MTTPRCPVCAHPATPEHRPFCGPRCRDRDLLRWLEEGYRIPGPGPRDDGLDSPADPD